MTPALEPLTDDEKARLGHLGKIAVKNLSDDEFYELQRILQRATDDEVNEALG